MHPFRRLLGAAAAAGRGPGPFPRAIRSRALAVCLAGALTVGAAHAQDRPDLSLHWGSFGVLDSESLFEVGLEYRFPTWRHDLRPIVGASLLEDGGNYTFGGLRWEHRFAESWTVSPSFAAGIYSAGGIDLGGPIEFRSGIDVGYDFELGTRAAVGFYHLSNGGIYSRNGGSESFLFSLSWSL